MSDDWDEDYLGPPTTAIHESSTYRPSKQQSQSTGWDNWRSSENRNEFVAAPRRGIGRAAYGLHGRTSSSSGRSGFGEQKNGNVPIVMKIPSKHVGRVIGRGGAKIADLQQDSGAKIFVTRETEGDTTLVKMFGTSYEVERARGLIEDLTVDEPRFNKKQAVEEKPRESTPPPDNQSTELLDWQELLRRSDEYAAAKWAKLPQTRKEFYKEHPEVTAMTDEEVSEFRLKKNNIVVERTFQSETSKPIPKPVTTFEQAFYNYPEILEEIQKAGFTTPSPIQCQAWPVLLSGQDLIGIAQTGTGKTLAFLLPALIHIDGQVSKRSDRLGPAVLVMAPTRELALQIDKEVKKYEYKGITSLCIYGGGSRREQIQKIDGIDIVIATPGRLNDLHTAGHLNLEYITYAVLDEADRMLDMGFEPQIRRIMYSVRPSRQTIMTSATWPEGVRSLAKSYMIDPVQIYVGTLDLAATHTVEQIIKLIEDSKEAKYAEFISFAEHLGPDEKVIVFCGQKLRADDLASDLVLAGFSVQSIHGNREQADREQALKDIADGTCNILVATDVASRGLDIDDITHVVNYDFPRNIEEYVHRVGRTGRAGKSGTSISYFTRSDWAQAKDLIAILEEANQHVPGELYDMAERHGAWKAKKRENGGGGGGRGGGGRFGGSRGGGGRRW